MSRHKARRAIGLIILGRILALFCMFPIGYDFNFNSWTKNESNDLNHPQETESVIAETAESIDETQLNSTTEKEGDTSRTTNIPGNPAISEKSIEEAIPLSTLDSRLPGAVYLHINEISPESPMILSEERISEEDTLVDISMARDDSLQYSVSESLELCICKIVYREAGTQSFLGKVFVAEGLVNRIRSGVYGTDVLAILKQGGYGAEMDAAGNYHIYFSSGIEVFDVPEADIAATKLALSGSTISNTVLEAETDMRNNQYGLSLGIECYRYGSIYHFNPDLVSEKTLSARTINRVPVSFKYEDHVFYGYWLNAKNALNIA